MVSPHVLDKLVRPDGTELTVGNAALVLERVLVVLLRMAAHVLHQAERLAAHFALMWLFFGVCELVLD